MTSSVASDILYAAQRYNVVSSAAIFALGTVGNLCNVLVFCSLALFRNNQFALYLVVEAIANVFHLIINFLIQLLVDAAGASLFWCKFRAMVITVCRLVAFSSVCFSAVDQCLSTSHDFRIRRLSTIKLARGLTISSIVLACLHTIPIGIFNEIRAGVCTVVNAGMAKYISYFYIPVVSGFLPITVASVLSVWAYRNVRRIVSRRVPLVRRRLDQQFTAMVLIRIIVFVIFSLPYTIERMYAAAAPANPAEPLSYALSALRSAITVSLFNLNYAISFYIFLLVSARFRRQVRFALVKIYWHRCCSRSVNRVRPIVDERSLHSTGVVE